MRYQFPAITIGLVLVLPVCAGDDGLSGRWKFSIHDGGQQVSFWLVNLESKDGKLKVTADPLKGAPKIEVKDVIQKGDTFTFSMQATIIQMGREGTVTFDFEGKLPKPGAKKIYGSFTQGGNTVPAVLDATTAKDTFELDRDIVLRTPNDPRALSAIFDLIGAARENKVDPKDLQDWVNSSLKASQLYGPRFLVMQQYRLLDSLQDQKAAYAAVVIETARQIAKQVPMDGSESHQLNTLSLAADILRSSDKKEEAMALDARLDKLEVGAYAAHVKSAIDFKLERFTGRKSKSKRAVLVELFTGAQCPPCVAADMAFDGLEKTYAPADVVLLQYHVHIPRPDPLANNDSDARYEYYLDVKKARGTPSSLFNGIPAAPGGGFVDDAAGKYKEYCEVVNKLLETPDAVKLGVTASRSGDMINITAKVQDLDKPGDRVRLRFALVEDWVRYRGSNGLAYHHRVVRATPGGAKGFTLKQKNADHSAEVDLGPLRKSLNKYLDEDYPEGARPMRLRDLRVVAFVQNDDTTEVLNAVDVPVTEKK